MYLPSIVAALLVAGQILVPLVLQPGEQAKVSCAGDLGPVTTSGGVVTVPCDAPPQPGTIVAGDAIGLPGNGGGVIVHQSAGLTSGGPSGPPRLTSGGAFQSDDRAGGRIQGLGCRLDRIEVWAGGDYRGGTSGTALIRVYAPETLQVTQGSQTPTPGWIAVSEGVVITSADPDTWRPFHFVGGNRVTTASGTWFAIDWLATTNDLYNMLVVKLNFYDGQRPFLNDGYTLRATANGVPIATPAYRVYEEC